MSETEILGRLVTPLLAAVREELELPFDEDAYSQALEDAISKQRLASDELVRKLKPVVAEPIASTGVSQTAG